MSRDRRWLLLAMAALSLTVAGCAAETGVESQLPDDRTPTEYMRKPVSVPGPRGGAQTVEEKIASGSDKVPSLAQAKAKLGFEPKIPRALGSHDLVGYWVGQLPGFIPKGKVTHSTFDALYDGDLVLGACDWQGMIADAAQFEAEVRGSHPPGLEIRVVEVNGRSMMAYDAIEHWDTDPDTGEVTGGFRVPDSQVIWWEGDGVSQSISSLTLTADELLEIARTLP